MAARIVSEFIKTSLGPKGMYKMLVDSLEDVAIANDGATMLKEMDARRAHKTKKEIAYTH